MGDVGAERLVPNGGEREYGGGASAGGPLLVELLEASFCAVDVRVDAPKKRLKPIVKDRRELERKR